MKKHLFLLATLFLSISLFAETYIPGGSVSGTWTKVGSPYKILGDIEINYADLLTIEAGVEVEFQWSFTLFVNGTILALGTAEDSITFTAADLDQGWKTSGSSTPRLIMTAPGSHTAFLNMERLSMSGRTILVVP